MNQKRDRKIRRIVDVQARLHRIAEWQLMEALAQETVLEDKQRRILEGFNDESKLPDLAVQAASRSLRSAGIAQGVIARTRERLAAHARDEGRKLKHAQRVMQAAEQHATRAEEKRVRDDEIDKAARRSIETR